MRPILLTAFGMACLVGTAGATQPQGQAQIETSQQQPVGTYLTDSEGRSVYLFKADSKSETTCFGACAEAWPPVITEGQPEAGGPKVEPQMLGTLERPDGAMQVTYNGWPLYYYVRDQQPGDIKGQDVESFGAEWYLVTPQGQVAHAEGEEQHQG